jgi:hypothetical protein
MQVRINIEVLKSVHAMTEDVARQKIKKTETVRIDERTSIKPKKPDEETIIVEASTNLNDGLMVIDLIDKDGGATTLAYDLEDKRFRQQDDDEDDD